MTDTQNYAQKDCGYTEPGNVRTRGLILTYRCNLNCTYCYIPVKSARIMPLKVAQEAISSVFETSQDYNRVEIQLLGAEPLTAFARLKEISEWVWSQSRPKPYILFATTNGTLLDEERKEWFRQNRQRFVLGLSYDGTDEAQDINRADSSALIDKRFFLDTWPQQPVKMTISQNSVKSLAKGVIRLTELGFKINANVAYESEPWTMESIAEYSVQLTELVDYYVQNPQAPRVSILRQNLPALMQNSGMEQHKYCGADRAFDVIDVDGQRYPCHFLSPLVLIGARLKQLRNENFSDEANFIDSRCQTCMLRNVCPTCAGSNYALTGSLRNRDLTHCRIFATDVVLNARLQYELLARKERLDDRDYETLRAVRAITRAVKSKFRSEGNKDGRV